MEEKVFLILATLLTLSRSSPPPEFQNPVMDTLESSPNVYLHAGGTYYYAVAVQNSDAQIEDGWAIDVLSSDELSDWRNAKRVRVYNGTTPHGKIWNPKIQLIDGTFYIYFSLGAEGDPWATKNFVIRADHSYNPGGTYGKAVKLTPPDIDTRSYDGTVLERDNGQLFFIWSGPMQNGTDLTSNLFIAPMATPMDISGNRSVLRVPSRPWEIFGGGTAESPQILKKDGRTFVIYSTSHYNTDKYCLGIIGIDYGRHPMVHANWWQDVDQCVMWQNEEQQVFGPGRPAFTTSPDGLEPWMLYLASSDANASKNKSVRAEPFGWDSNGFPVFPRPAGLWVRHAVP